VKESSGEEKTANSEETGAEGLEEKGEGKKAGEASQEV
jgi:hypothetical protein